MSLTNLCKKNILYDLMSVDKKKREDILLKFIKR